MPFGLTIGTERALALQQSIENELTRRGYSPDADPVMAEYITIMVINNKTAAQITSELEDLISSEIDPSFISWLFEEAAKGATGPELPPAELEAKQGSLNEPGPSREPPPHIPNESSSRRPTGAIRNGVYQQTISQVLPSSSAPQKRTASARSPSPSHPNKSRRTDLPTGPRAMLRDGSTNSHGNNPRSLLDRVGGVATSGRGGGPNGYGRDEIQMRIENVTNNAPDPNMMMPPGFPGMGGVDMNALAMANMNFQEMIGNAFLQQFMGFMNSNGGQFGNAGFPMQGVMPSDMAMFQAAMNNGFQGQPQVNGPGANGAGRGRGSGRGGRGSGRGRGGASVSGSSNSPAPVQTTSSTLSEAKPIVAPSPITPNPTPVAAFTSNPLETVHQNLAYAIPERPQSPRLCKFATKCTNPHCRYSHPSPVATAESGVVLSNEPCEKGKECKDIDCTRAHVSPAVLNPNAAEMSIPAPGVPAFQPVHPAPTAVPCRFGLGCTRPGCTFSHPPRFPQQQQQHAQPCRFGAACTRANCTFQHPPGRVLPSTFHRGLSTTGPLVNIPTPETGSMGGPSHHKSVKFNNPTNDPASIKEKIEKRMKEIEEEKLQMEKAMKEAASSKKDDANPVAITA